MELKRKKLGFWGRHSSVSHPRRAAHVYVSDVVRLVVPTRACATSLREARETRKRPVVCGAAK